MYRSLIISILVATQGTIPAQDDRSIRFEIETLGGRTLTQADFESSVLLIDYWGTWCSPCRKAIPFLVELYEKYKHHGLEIIGLSYENRDGDHTAKVREFAKKHRITYPLALGTPEQMRLVENFKGYPTMLFLRKGLAFDHVEVGFTSAAKPKIEAWIRKALDIDGNAEPTESDEENGPEPEPEPETIPDGVIFWPGENDQGFQFQAEDVDGNPVEFKKFRGQPVILGLTSTWDREAVATSRLLQEFHSTLSSRGSVVLAAYLEMSRDRKSKIESIRAFRKKHSLDYAMIPAGLGFQKKIHLFSGMPLFLVFDQQGTLALREAGTTASTAERIKAKVEALLR